ncbi:FlgD immunoglobulin-like domain containing protein [Fibrobacterota bacterium]
MLVNTAEDSDDYSCYLERRLRQLLPIDVQIGDLAVVQQDGQGYLIAGSKSQGLYYLKLGDTLWTNLNRQTKLEDGLKEVITFPSIYNGSADVGIGYQIKQSAGVTIRVYNYAMEEVRTITSDSRRRGGSARSEDPQQDRWDGRDDYGNPVSAGMYYILVKSDKGEKGWGKVMVVNGR